MSLELREPALAELVGELEGRFGDQLQAVLLYGSCRRSRDFTDGLVDLYAVVSDRQAVERPATAWLGAWLPPNVYYLQTAKLRCKCGLFAMAELERAVHCDFHSYVWGRLAQPVELIAVRSPGLATQVERLLSQARHQFLRRSRDLAVGDDVCGVWEAGLQASYRAELRVETESRAADIVAADLAWYQHVGEGVLAGLGPTGQPARARREWRVRAAVGKALSLARLVKGLATFDGAIDYIVWKLERHSGQQIEVPERVRSWPWVFVWPFAFSLWRRGIFR